MATVGAWSVHVFATVSCMSVFGGGDDVFVCLLRERHITNGLGVAVLSCVYFRAGHSTEATVRTNDETTQHSDALQRLMCAKSAL